MMRAGGDMGCKHPGCDQSAGHDRESVLSSEPDMPKYDKWIPSVGDVVFSNFDSGPPMGKVVGYLNRPGEPRHGQPVIEVTEGDRGFLSRPKGARFICHPMFLWPFSPGSPE